MGGMPPALCGKRAERATGFEPRGADSRSYRTGGARPDRRAGPSNGATSAANCADRTDHPGDGGHTGHRGGHRSAYAAGTRHTRRALVDGLYL